MVGDAMRELEQGPLERPTAAAMSYAAFLQARAAITDSDPVTVSCTISNMGKRPIRQLTVQVSLLDKGHRVITWQQGPVIRRVGDNGAFTTIGNAFSQAVGPLRPTAGIMFKNTFSNVWKDKGITTADIEVLDIAFAGNVIEGDRSMAMNLDLTPYFLLLVCVFLVTFVVAVRSARKRTKIQMEEAFMRQEEGQKLLKQILDAQAETNRLLREMIDKAQTKG